MNGIEVLLKLRLAAIAKSRVQSLAIVKAFDVLQQGRTRLCAGGKRLGGALGYLGCPVCCSAARSSACTPFVGND
jgi:hypothetical protein